MKNTAMIEKNGFTVAGRTSDTQNTVYHRVWTKTDSTMEIRMMVCGGAVQTVSKYMGHSDSTITLQVYSHFIPDTQEKALNALNNLFQE